MAKPVRGRLMNGLAGFGRSRLAKLCKVAILQERPLILEPQGLSCAHLTSADQAVIYAFAMQGRQLMPSRFSLALMPPARPCILLPSAESKLRSVTVANKL